MTETASHEAPAPSEEQIDHILQRTLEVTS